MWFSRIFIVGPPATPPPPLLAPHHSAFLRWGIPKSCDSVLPLISLKLNKEDEEEEK